MSDTLDTLSAEHPRSLEESQPSLVFELDEVDLSIVPSTSSLVSFRPSPAYHPVIGDNRTIRGLLGKLRNMSGLSTLEIARRMGITPQALRPYFNGTIEKPSLRWFIKFVEVCGGRLHLELPQK